MRLPLSATQTSDADFAQFQAVSEAVEDSLPPLLDLFRKNDPSFREIPHQIDGRKTVAFENGARYRVEFLTPNRGSEDRQGNPAPMPAPGGASAQPLRFLDFLIRDPVRSVMLHRSGVAVTVPAPERYAVHKLIVATRRRGDPDGSLKRDKDIAQAALLMEALATTRSQRELAFAWSEAWNRGPAWKEALGHGFSLIPKQEAARLRAAIIEGLGDISASPSDHGLA